MTVGFPALLCFAIVEVVGEDAEMDANPFRESP
jgi:hypothetical protein